MCVCVRACVYVCMRVSVCASVCVCVCVCVCGWVGGCGSTFIRSCLDASMAEESMLFNFSTSLLS